MKELERGERERERKSEIEEIVINEKNEKNINIRRDCERDLERIITGKQNK